MLPLIEKDILFNIDDKATEGRGVALLHGCNCMHIMGAGIARYLRDTYPIVYSVDVSMTRKNDKNKLGTYSVAVVAPKFHILNCYTQFNTQPDTYGNPPIDYNALRVCLQRVNKAYDGWEIRVPMIGCGLAGGEWSIVRNMIEEELGAQPHAAIYLGARR